MLVESARTHSPRSHRPLRNTYTPGPSLDLVGQGGATIRRGHSGEDVRAIQRALNAAGANPPLAEDGLFGPKTQAALRGFQRENGAAEPSGAVDAATLDKLRPFFSDVCPTGDAPRSVPRNAPRFGDRAPDGTIRAGSLQQGDESRRNVRRHREESQPPVDQSRVPGEAPRAPDMAGGCYDGCTPATGTTSTRASAANTPPLTTSEGAGRDANTYSQVINQFGVGNNPRYTPRNGNTYCNIFAWDVTRAMGAEIPHWVHRDGTPAQPFERGAHELSANGTATWLREHGGEQGWRRATAEEAQANANNGRPSIAIRENPGAIGHVVVVRPGEMTDRGPAIAQAGSRCTNDAHIRDIFRRSEPEYWVHD